MTRVSVAWSMGLVAIIALGLAAMRAGTLLACCVAEGTMLVGLSVASVGAMVRPAPAASWRGFAVFGWIYFVTTFVHPDVGLGSVFGAPIEWAVVRLHPHPTEPPMPTDPIVLQIRFDRNGRVSFPTARSSGGPTTAELDGARRYNDARAAYDRAVVVRGQALEFAARIGHASLTLAFGLLGAIVGRMMAPGGPRSSRGLIDRTSTP